MAKRLLGICFSLVALLSVIDCGGDAKHNQGSADGPSSGGSSSGDSGTSTETSDTNSSVGGSEGVTTTAGSGSTGSGATGSDGTSTGGRAPNAEVELTDAIVYSDCTPGVRGDTIIAKWTANISGAEGYERATLTRATARIVGARTVTQQLTVEPETIELEDGAGSAEQRKTGADLDPGQVCLDLCQQVTWSLELVFDVGSASAEGDFTCPS